MQEWEERWKRGREEKVREELKVERKEYRRLIEDVTGTGYWFRVSSIVSYSVCFMFGFEYRLILSMFYVWFRVSFDTQYVLCLVSSIF